MKTFDRITDLIGGTPLLKLTNFCAEKKLDAEIYGKLEYFNPAGSAKDRIAKAMIDEAESRGILKTGSVIIEPTSGNTGIGLAAVAASRGYRVIDVYKRQVMYIYMTAPKIVYCCICKRTKHIRLKDYGKKALT